MFMHARPFILLLVIARPPPEERRDGIWNEVGGWAGGSWHILLWTSPLSQRKPHPIISLLRRALGLPWGLQWWAAVAASTLPPQVHDLQGLELQWRAPRGCLLRTHRGGHPAGVETGGCYVLSPSSCPSPARPLSASPDTLFFFFSLVLYWSQWWGGKSK